MKVMAALVVVMLAALTTRLWFLQVLASPKFVRLANDNQYGLGGYVTSGSVERAMAVGRRLRAGTISINGGTAYGADAPFGGYKASGIGRQNGIEGFQQYTEVKTIAVSA